MNNKIQQIAYLFILAVSISFIFPSQPVQIVYKDDIKDIDVKNRKNEAIFKQSYQFLNEGLDYNKEFIVKTGKIKKIVPKRQHAEIYLENYPEGAPFHSAMKIISLSNKGNDNLEVGDSLNIYTRFNIIYFLDKLNIKKKEEKPKLAKIDSKKKPKNINNKKTTYQNQGVTPIVDINKRPDVVWNERRDFKKVYITMTPENFGEGVDLLMESSSLKLHGGDADTRIRGTVCPTNEYLKHIQGKSQPGFDHFCALLIDTFDKSDIRLHSKKYNSDLDGGNAVYELLVKKKRSDKTVYNIGIDSIEVDFRIVGQGEDLKKWYKLVVQSEEEFEDSKCICGDSMNEIEYFSFYDPYGIHMVHSMIDILDKLPGTLENYTDDSGELTSKAYNAMVRPRKRVLEFLTLLINEPLNANVTDLDAMIKIDARINGDRINDFRYIYPDKDVYKGVRIYEE